MNLLHAGNALKRHTAKYHLKELQHILIDFYLKTLHYFLGVYWKLNPASTQLGVEFIVCKNVMDCPFVQMNYPVWILV